MNSLYPPYFPVEALPPILKNAVLEAQTNIQAPLPLIVSSVLGAISLACQNRIDVRRMNGLESPCSLFVLSIAESGERKSTIDKLFTKPILDFEDKQAIAMKPKLEKYKSEKLRWKEEKNGISLAIRAHAKKGKSTGDLNKLLEEIVSREPIEPIIQKLIYSDATTESITSGLYKHGASAGIMSDEGGIIFNSRTLYNPGMLNMSWDGGTLHVDRATSESFSVRNPRLTISLMVQPKTFDKFLKKQGDLLRDNGFLARCLVSFPYSTQGDRFINNPNPSWHHLTIYKDRLSEILNGPMPEIGQNSFPQITLEFSPEAQSRWIQFNNNVESELSLGKYLSDVKDCAAKIADNAARMAALFHYVEGMDGKISLDTINQATLVCEWYLHEFKRIFGIKPDIPQEVLDANVLEKWLFDLCRRYPGACSLKKNAITQLGPYQLRNKIRRDAALTVLSFGNKVQIGMYGKTQLVLLNPDYFLINPSYHSPLPPQYRPLH